MSLDGEPPGSSGSPRLGRVAAAGKQGAGECVQAGMAKRKPQGQSWESFIDRQVREATERGEFDNLPGAGKPIPDLRTNQDELWWLRSLMKREGLSMEPEALRVRKRLEETLVKIARQRTEDAVRRLVDGINADIADVNSTATWGPSSNLAPLDGDEVVKRWQARRTDSA